MIIYFDQELTVRIWIVSLFAILWLDSCFLANKARKVEQILSGLYINRLNKLCKGYENNDYSNKRPRIRRNGTYIRRQYFLSVADPN